MGEDWVFKKAWDHLSAAVLDDNVDPFVRAHGNSNLTAIEDPRVDKLFNTAMSSHSRIYMEAMLGAYHGFQDDCNFIHSSFNVSLGDKVVR